MIKLNLSQKIGVILVIISLLLAFTDIINTPIRFLTQPLLMGSSKGKDRGRLWGSYGSCGSSWKGVGPIPEREWI